MRLRWRFLCGKRDNDFAALLFLTKGDSKINTEKSLKFDQSKGETLGLKRLPSFLFGFAERHRFVFVGKMECGMADVLELFFRGIDILLFGYVAHCGFREIFVAYVNIGSGQGINRHHIDSCGVLLGAGGELSDDLVHQISARFCEMPQSRGQKLGWVGCEVVVRFEGEIAVIADLAQSGRDAIPV